LGVRDKGKRGGTDQGNRLGEKRERRELLSRGAGKQQLAGGKTEIGGLGGKLGARDKGKRGKRGKRERGTDQGNRLGEKRERRELLSSFWRLLPLAQPSPNKVLLLLQSTLQPSQRRRLATRLERLGIEPPTSALGRL
jgi:hypothetical protein